MNITEQTVIWVGLGKNKYIYHVNYYNRNINQGLLCSMVYIMSLLLYKIIFYFIVKGI